MSREQVSESSAATVDTWINLQSHRRHWYSLVGWCLQKLSLCGKRNITRFRSSSALHVFYLDTTGSHGDWTLEPEPQHTTHTLSELDIITLFGTAASSAGNEQNCDSAVQKDEYSNIVYDNLIVCSLSRLCTSPQEGERSVQSRWKFIQSQLVLLLSLFATHTQPNDFNVYLFWNFFCSG